MLDELNVNAVCVLTMALFLTRDDRRDTPWAVPNHKNASEFYRQAFPRKTWALRVQMHDQVCILLFDQRLSNAGVHRFSIPRVNLSFA